MNTDRAIREAAENTGAALQALNEMGADRTDAVYTRIGAANRLLREAMREREAEAIIESNAASDRFHRAVHFPGYYSHPAVS